MPFNLLIADDAPDVADIVGFGARLVWPDCVLHVARDGQAALAAFAAKPPDLVVLDIAMPPPDGFEVCRSIRAVSRVPILMLTVHDATADKIRALELGADDYLTKPFDHLELLARLRALVRRSAGWAGPATLSPKRLVVGDVVLDTTTREVYRGDARISLTRIEYRLFEELMRHAGDVLTHEHLLKRVWGPQYVHDTHYLKVFMQRLRRKLGDDPQHPRYIHTEWGIGYACAAPAALPPDVQA